MLRARTNPQTADQHRPPRGRLVGRMVAWLHRLRVDPDALIESLAAATALETGVLQQVHEFPPRASEPSAESDQNRLSA